MNSLKTVKSSKEILLDPNCYILSPESDKIFETLKKGDKVFCRISTVETSGGKMIAINDIHYKKPLDSRIVSASKKIDNVMLGVSVIGTVVLGVLGEIYKDSKDDLRIISAVAAGLNILIAICPAKSKILDALKKKSDS